MTAIVGVLCKNGVVIGADSSATFVHGQYRTIEQPIDKIDVIACHVIVAGTGSIGLGQRFCSILRDLWNDKKFTNSEIHVAKLLSRKFLEDLNYTFLKPGQYGALVAFPVQQKICLCEFDVQYFQPELKNERLWYVSMGSAQPIMDPFLGFIREIFWQGGPLTLMMVYLPLHGL